jgi:hypothetical protein
MQHTRIPASVFHPQIEFVRSTFDLVDLCVEPAFIWLNFAAKRADFGMRSQ